MSVLSSIRKNSWLMLIVIGLALAAFILSDFWRRANTNDTNIVGTVNGDEINIQDYSALLQEAKASRQGSSAPDAIIQDNVWNALVSDKLLYQQLEKIGISPQNASKQYYDVIKNILLQQGIKDAETLTPEKYEQMKNSNPAAIAQYNAIERQAKSMILQENYLGLLQQGFLITDKEIEFEKQIASQTADIDYVYIPYEGYSGADKIKIDDAAIETYVNNHKNQFKTEEARDIQYVLINGNASPKDVNKIKSELAQYINNFEEKNPTTGKMETVTGFSSTSDNQGFVAAYSDEQFNDSYIAVDQLPREMVNIVSNASLSTVVGPYAIGQEYMALTKVLGKKNIQDSIQIGKMLISYVGAQNQSGNTTLSKEKAKEKADNLLNQLKSNPSSFSDVAKNNSDDEQSRLNGGNLQWISYQQLSNNVDPKLKEFLSNSSAGSFYLVETAAGYEIFKINDKRGSKPAYLLANVIKNVLPSKKTNDSVNLLARKVTEQMNGKSTAELQKIAKNLKVTLNSESNVEQFKLQPNSFANLTAGGNQEGISKILSWAFDNETEINASNTFSLANGNQIIAVVTAQYEKGISSTKQARKVVEPILKNQEIAKAIIKKAANSKDLNTVATSFGKEVGSATGISFNRSVIQGVGNESIIGGAAFATKINTTSAPLEGKTGVFVIKPTKINKIESKVDDKTIKNNLKQTNRRMAFANIFQALEDAADIVDMRGGNPNLIAR